MAANLTKQELAERLRRGPSYLFVGQAWIKTPGGQDLFLAQALKKFEKPDALNLGYKALLQTSAGTSPQDTISWLHDRCNYIPLPEAFETITEFPWNGVATSAIDDVLAGGFRKPWRDVQKVATKTYQAADPRSRTKLNVWYLFGSVAAPDADGWPPLTPLQFITRKATATVLADAMPELITPLGVLCIEGYDPATDWFTPEALYQAFSALNPGQVHLFSVRDQHRKEPLLAALASEDKLTFHEETLAQFLADTTAIGWLHLGQTPAEAEFGHSIRANGHSVVVPNQLFLQIQTTARLVTELAFAPLKIQSRDVRYAEFRNFLYQSSHRPDWEGYARGFAFRRAFQTQLAHTLKKKIENLSLRSEPIILHGPTGSGKTVALGQLAFDVQKEGHYPVVFIDRHVRQIRKETIDKFCNWAEDQGAAAVVVIWDGMLDPRQYRELDHYLRSRGRRCVLVGTCYQTDANYQTPTKGLPVSPSMSAGERQDFLQFLGSIDHDLPARFANVSQADSESFLGSLYRYLPETRGAIHAGLGMEVAHAEDLLLQLRIPVEQTKAFGNSLGELLTNVGVSGSPQTFGPTVTPIGGEDASEIRQLFGFIMVPGQFGLSCPFELLMRAVGRSPGSRLLPMLERIDLFRITDDSEGNPLIGPRSPLEATLVNRRIMGGAKAEIDYASKLLAQLRSSIITGLREVDFCVDLLRFLGPNGPKPRYYAPHFVILADCLSDLRANSGLRNVRLLLQESVLLREAAKVEHNQDVSRSLLNRSIEVCKEGLTLVERRPNYRLIQTQLLVELSATLGALAKAEDDVRARYTYVEQAHEQAFRAFGIDPTSHYPLDVIAWTADDLLCSESLGEEDRLRIIESVTHAFALAESEDWDTEVRNQLDVRKAQLGEKVFGAHLTEEAFNNLLTRGSAAGIVLRAYRIAEPPEGKKSPIEDRMHRASQALALMDNYPAVVRKDPRALFLRFKLWWRKKTRTDFNEKERLAVPFDRQDWDECVSTLGDLLAFEEFHSNLTLRLIEAVAFFHRGEYRKGFDAFEQIEAEQIFARNRVIRRYLFSDEHGAPRKFSGTITQVGENQIGFVAVGGFPKGIPFIVRESGKIDAQTGDDFNGFRIAFNMRGPIVDFRI